jgi:hypothetical protein
MEREVFIQPSGKSVLAWDLLFGAPQQHIEIRPAVDNSEGHPSRTGRAHITIESTEVKFCAYPGSLAVGEKGQLSSNGDQFFDVTITGIAPAGDHCLVIGNASREVDIRLEWDR